MRINPGRIDIIRILGIPETEFQGMFYVVCIPVCNIRGIVRLFKHSSLIHGNRRHHGFAEIQRQVALIFFRQQKIDGRLPFRYPSGIKINIMRQFVRELGFVLQICVQIPSAEIISFSRRFGRLLKFCTVRVCFKRYNRIAAV